jgi:hypothetical protein
MAALLIRIEKGSNFDDWRDEAQRDPFMASAECH